MHKLLYYVCDELDELEQKAERDGKLSMAEIQYGDILAHFKKNLLSSAEMMDEMGSSSYRGRSSEEGYSNARGRGRGARRNANGRYASSYSREGSNYDDGGSSYEGSSYRSSERSSYRGRGYSRDDGNKEFIENLRELMQDAPDEQKRQSIQQMIQQMEQQ